MAFYVKFWSLVRIEEVKEGKIWNIHYEMENLVFTDPKAMEGFKMLGVDFANEKFAQKVFYSNDGVWFM